MAASWLLALLLAAPFEVPNASFELADPAQAGRPAWWTTSFPNGAQHVWDEAVAHTGRRSVRVTGLDPAQMPTNVVAWRADCDAPPPGRYELAVWVRADQLTQPASFRLLLKDAAGTVLRNAAFTVTGTTYDWKPVRGLVELGPEVKRLQLVLGLTRSTGSVWFDDVLLRAIQEGSSGQARFAPVGPFATASEQALGVVYTVGEAGLAPGGGVRLDVPHWREQRFWSRLDGFTARCSRAGVKLAERRGERQTKVWPPSIQGGLVTVTTAPDSPRLVAGDRIELSWSLQTPAVVTEAATFQISADTAGDGFYDPVATHRCELTGAAPARLWVSATATPAPGEEARLTIAACDANQNPAPSFAGEVALTVEGGASTVPAAVTIAPADLGTKRLIVRFEAPGIHHVTARGGGLEGRSHPIWVRQDPLGRIHFGDLHVHGEASADAVGPQPYTHIFARDYLGLDFAAIADHAGGGPEWAPWARTKRSNQEARNLPWYDTIHGYERSFPTGHKNVYFPDDDPPFYGGNDTLALWEQLGGREALTIPHTPNTDSGNAYKADGTKVWSTMDWRPRNDDYQRVVEIVQVRGSFEQDAIDKSLRVVAGGHGASVQDALAQGHTMGFIGSTDTHDGLPGSKPAWAAVIAPRPERRSLWTALRDRRCYATSGARILVAMDLNGEPLGGEVRVPSATTPREIRCEVAGTAPIQRIDLIRGGKLFASSTPQGEHVTFRGFDDEPLTGRTYYYVRVIQEDTHLAWTSPVWVTPAG